MSCIPKFKQIYILSKHNLEKTKVEEIKLYILRWEKKHIKLIIFSAQQVNNGKKKKKTST